MGVFQTEEQYKIAVAATASTALSVPDIAIIKNRNGRAQVELYAYGCGVVVKFGDSSVAADATADGTTKKLVKGNIQIPQGGVLLYTLPAAGDYISVISDDETSTGTLWMKTGQGEDE